LAAASRFRNDAYENDCSLKKLHYRRIASFLRVSDVVRFRLPGANSGGKRDKSTRFL
jgi:hypothetical protein